MYNLNPLKLFAKKDDGKAKPPQGFNRDMVAALNDTLADWQLGSYDNPDDLVGKKGLTVYKTMRNDEQVKACQQAKIKSRLCTTYEIKAGDPENALSKEIAEFIDDQLAGIKGTFKTKLRDIMTARDYGFSITEKLFEIIEDGKWRGKIGLKDLKTKEPFNFKFKVDKYRNLEGILLDTLLPRQDSDDLGTAKKPFPVDKFVIYTANKEFGNWYGQSDFREAYRSYWSKNFIMKFHNIFLERFGMPAIKVSYPEEYRQDGELMDILDNLLKNYQSKTGFRVPEGVSVDLIEAVRAGKASYETAIEMHDKKIARALLWPDMAMQAGEKGGSFALAKKRFSLFILILEEMGYEIEDTIMQDQIIRPLVNLNWGIVEESLMPQFVFEPLEEEDTKLRSEIIQIMIDKGVVDPEEEWIRDFVNIPEMDEAIRKKREEEAERREKEGNKPPDDDDTNTDDDTKPDDNNPDKPFAYQLRREPTEFERKVNFARLARVINSYEDHLRNDLTEVVMGWKKHIFNQVQKAFNTKSLNDVKRMWIRNSKEFERVLKNWLVKIHLDSKFNEMEVLKKSGLDIELVKKPIPRSQGFALSEYALPEFDPWEVMPISDAIKFFNAKRLAYISRKGGKRKLITLGKRKELDFYDKQAFAISGIESEYILGKAKMITMAGIRNGTQRESIRALESLFDKYINLGELKDGKLLSPSRLENIVRTNTNSALNKAREDLFVDPDIDDFVPWVEYSAILDDRTCFPADTKVQTKTGIRNIQDIQLNDEVITHTGEHKKVYGLHKRIYKGKFVKIKTGNKELICSADHLIYDGQNFVPANSLIVGGKIACLKK